VRDFELRGHFDPRIREHFLQLDGLAPGLLEAIKLGADCVCPLRGAGDVDDGACVRPGETPDNAFTSPTSRRLSSNNFF